MKIETEDPSADEIGMNLTPMIDVVFLLLIFFMVATTFLDPERDIELELPQAENAGTESAEIEEIVINVQRDGSYVVSGQKVDEAGLLQNLKSTATRDPDITVTIRGDRLVAYEAIVHVMDLCSGVGLTNYNLGTVQSEG